MKDNMKCNKCGQGLVYKRGNVSETYKFIGTVTAYNVYYLGCDKCETVISYPNKTAEEIDKARKKKLDDFIQKEPFEKLLTPKQAYSLLEISKQAFQQNPKHYFLIYHTIKDGKKYFHIDSVKKFMNDGDGRFDISPWTATIDNSDALYNSKIASYAGYAPLNRMQDFISNLVVAR